MINTLGQKHAEQPIEGPIHWLDEDMTELSLLLPGREAAALEKLAHSSGLTLGQILRLLIQNYLSCQIDSPTASGREESGIRPSPAARKDSRVGQGT